MASGATDQQNGGKERKNSGAPLRTRKSNGKSRGGCLVCKKRRIKVRGFAMMMRLFAEVGAGIVVWS